MLLETNQSGVFTAGSADMMCILKLPSGTYHPAFYEEHPMPGPIQPIAELSTIRLKSKMHHTSGFATFEEAQEDLKKLREKIILPDANVFWEEAIETDDPLGNFMIANWTRGVIPLKDALGQAFGLVIS